MRTADGTARIAQHDVDADTHDRIAAAVLALGSTIEKCIEYAAAVTEQPETLQPLARLKASVEASGIDLGNGAFERFVLTSTAARALSQLDSRPLSPSVKTLCRQAFTRFADPRRNYDLSHNHFIAFCKVASLRRFPAGQFDWEPSGLPRSWVPKIRPIGALVRTLRLIAQIRGFGPAFFIHMGTGGRNYALLEAEANRSYYRMAQSLALQPDMQGLIAASWLHSPDTFSISPHLGWLNRVFAENGAILATIGPADPDCGVLHRSPERQSAYQEGRFTPTVGLVIWPRAEMLAWARRHPELEA